MPKVPVVYKEVDGFSAYRVGTDGSIWTRLRLGGPKPTVGNIWKQMQFRSKKLRYYMVVLSNPYTKSRMRSSIHVLVLTAFRGPSPEGEEGRHLNGNPHDNRLANLAWSTHLVNMRDRDKHGTLPRGEINKAAKLTEENVKEVRFLLSKGVSQRQISKRFGVSKYPIWAIANGKNWTHV